MNYIFWKEAIITITRKRKYDIRRVFDRRMLINKVFVIKLKGVGECMIQEITNLWKGSSIKIMSNIVY